MNKYKFYYDESSHSRKINLDTVNAENYYDNFIVSVVGWKEEKEKDIFEKYEAFEAKYADRKSKGELKSQTLKQNQFKYGFASVNKSNAVFLKDYFSVFNEDTFLYLAITSKIEYIIAQIFDNYENSFIFDADLMKYSIVKALLMYRPVEIIEGVFVNTGELVEALKNFFENRILINQKNESLKQTETAAFTEILLVLKDIHEEKNLEWNYDMPFVGLKKYLVERSISEFSLIIDKEGENEKTLNCAKKVGFYNAIERDSKDSMGVRVADMFAGILLKLLVGIHEALRYNSAEEQLQKKVLSKEWFTLRPDQLELYKKLYYIVCVMNDAWYKTYSGRYSDDLVVLVALLRYMNGFCSVEEIKAQGIEKQGEYFNAYACKCIEDSFIRIRNKLPIDLIPDTKGDFFFNQRGAKVYYDISKQPALKLINGKKKCNVLSVGTSKEGVPMITVQEQQGVNCYRLPHEMVNWAMDLVGMANKGTNLLPAEVVFRKIKGKLYADIL